MKSVREWMQDKRVAGVLAGVAVLFVGDRMIGSGAAPAPAVPATAVAPPPSAAARGTESSAGVPFPPASPSAAPIPSGYAGPSWSWNRNPFLGPAAEGTTARAAGSGSGADATGSPGEGDLPDLRGTIVSGTVSMAIFRSRRPDGGNRLVPVGGKVGGWTLAVVEPYRVFLRRGKETRFLELYKQ